MTHLQRLVSQAAQRLDVEHPDWFTKVMVTVLDTSNCYMCVLGQLFGSYGRREAQEFLRPTPTLYLAFTPRTFIEKYLLDRYWTREIGDRCA